MSQPSSIQNNLSLASNQTPSQGSTLENNNFNLNTNNCSYHNTLHDTATYTGNTEHYQMARFLAEGPGDQASVFIRDDTGKLSISKGCTCDVPENFKID